MPEVPYHGWTHRPKALGGTDPIEFPEASGPDWRPFPNVALSCSELAWTKWPGGVRVLRAASFNVGGVDTNGGGSTGLSDKFVRLTVTYDGPSSDLANAPTSFTLDPYNMDVPMDTDPGSGGGPGGRRYLMWVRARCGTPGVDGSKVYMGTSQSELGDSSALIGAVQDLPTDGKWGLYGPFQVIARSGNDVAVKVWSDGEGTFTFDVELFMLFPYTGAVADAYGGSVNGGAEWVPADMIAGAGSTFPANYDSGYASFADLGEDTQAISHLLSGQLVWSFFDTNGNIFAYGDLDANARAQVNNPYHYYLAARPGGDMSGLGFLTLGRAGIPIGSAMVGSYSWAIYYMGIANPYWETTELAMWVPEDDTTFQPYDSPATSVIIGTGHLVSSLLDYPSGGRGPVIS